LVIDITTYAYSHPGGDFLLTYNIGRDVSKFFFGSYALDGNHNNPAGRNNRWAHSNIARKVANSHAIGALVRTNTAVATFKIDHPEILEVNSFTKCFPMVSTSHRVLPGVSNYNSEL
jgi:cytochrome b involved in lipid metabolism